MGLQVGEPAVVDAKQLGELEFLSIEARTAIGSLPSDELDGLAARLLESDRPREAHVVTPFLLPIRQAVWWTCLCVWNSCRNNGTAVELSSLKAVLQWVCRPTAVNVENAAAAAKHAEQFSPLLPAGICASAIELIGPLYSIEQLPDDGDESNVTAIPTKHAYRAAKTLLGASDFSIGLAKKRGQGSSSWQLAQFGVDLAAGKIPWV